MVELLPIKFLREEDSLIFGRLNVSLAKLARLNLPVANGAVITPPNLILKTTLEHFNFDDHIERLDKANLLYLV